MSAFLRTVAPVLLAGLAIAAGASAQPQVSAPPTVGQVTVTGRRAADEDMIRAVIAPFVTSHAARDRKSGLLLRAAPTGICPVALGLPEAFDDFVIHRIIEVARQAGAAMEPKGRCRPNVEVLFTSRPQVVIDALARQTHGEILGFHFLGEKGPLIHVTRPIQAWYITGTRGDSSSQDKRLDSDGTVSGDHAQVRIDRAYGGGLDTGTGSLVPPRNRSQFVNVLILADAGKLAGHEIGPVADYVALLALSQPQNLDGCGALPSILDLLASGCGSRPAPRALTDSDLAFLKALYAADLSSSAGAARAQMARQMARDIPAPPSRPPQ
jgi:hypothetical protein